MEGSSDRAVVDQVRTMNTVVQYARTLCELNGAGREAVAFDNLQLATQCAVPRLLQAAMMETGMATRKVIANSHALMGPLMPVRLQSTSWRRPGDDTLTAFLKNVLATERELQRMSDTLAAAHHPRVAGRVVDVQGVYGLTPPLHTVLLRNAGPNHPRDAEANGPSITRTLSCFGNGHKQQYYRAKIKPRSTQELIRRIQSAYNDFEEALFSNINSQLSPAFYEIIDKLTEVEINYSEWEGEGNMTYIVSQAQWYGALGDITSMLHTELVLARALVIDSFSTDTACCEHDVRSFVQENGMLLEHVGTTFRDNEAIVRAAVGQNPEALKYASERMKIRLLSPIATEIRAKLEFQTDNFFADLPPDMMNGILAKLPVTDQRKLYVALGHTQRPAPPKASRPSSLSLFNNDTTNSHLVDNNGTKNKSVPKLPLLTRSRLEAAKRLSAILCGSCPS